MPSSHYIPAPEVTAANLRLVSGQLSQMVASVSGDMGSCHLAQLLQISGALQVRLDGLERMVVELRGRVRL